MEFFPLSIQKERVLTLPLQAAGCRDHGLDSQQCKTPLWSVNICSLMLLGFVFTENSSRAGFVLQLLFCSLLQIQLLATSIDTKHPQDVCHSLPFT